MHKKKCLLSHKNGVLLEENSSHITVEPKMLCRKIASFLPSEGEFSEKLGIFSKVKIFQNPSCYILEKINENYDNFFWLS